MVPVVEGTRGLKRIYRQLEDQSIKNDTDQFFFIMHYATPHCYCYIASFDAGYQ